MATRPILLVGGVAMKSSAEVFEAWASALGTHARRLPDGETGRAAIGSDGRERSSRRPGASKRKASILYPADRRLRSTESSRARLQPTLNLVHSAMSPPLLNPTLISPGSERPVKFRPQPVFR